MKTQTSILVIDDETIVCESFKKILSNEGYKVDTKSHPHDGLKLATSHAYDLVFLDLIMEEMDGMELFQNLRKKDPDVPVVIVTGYPSMSTAIESVRLRASDYILKPFTPEEILKSVDNVLRQKDMLNKDAKTRSAKHLEILEWESACKPFRFYESAWLQKGMDGSVRVGGQIPNLFLNNIQEIQIPEVNSIAYCGLPLSGVVLNDDSKIIVPSPLTGRVIDVNYEIAETPSIVEGNNFNESWIARIYPKDQGKTIQDTHTRNVTLLCKEEESEKAYLPRLYDLGCNVTCAHTAEKAVKALIEEKNKVILVDSVSLSDAGPSYVQRINLEVPDAKIIVIDKKDSKLEESYRKAKILYYCVDSLFSNEILDILFCVFTSFNAPEILETEKPGFLPKSISRIHITNKHSKKVTLLVFGELMHYSKGIGHILIKKYLEKAYPLEVMRSIIRSGRDEITGQQKIEKEKERSDLIITLEAKASDKIPGQLYKEMEDYKNSEGEDCLIVNLTIQPSGVVENEQMLFNNVTTRGIADFLFNEMTAE